MMIHPTNSNLQVLSEGQSTVQHKKERNPNWARAKIKNPKPKLSPKEHNYKRHKANAERRHTWT